MADRYWVNGNGNWSSTAQWSVNPGGSSGASVPLFTDNVIFDRAATYSVTLDAATRSCNDITVSAGTVTFVYTNILNIYGSLSYIAGVIHSGASNSTFKSTSTGKTITSNGTTFGNGIIFSGDGGEWTFGSSLTGGTCSVQAGTLTLNGFTLTSSTVGISNTFNKKINFGAANWVMSSTPMSCNTVTGFSWTGTGGITTAMSVNKTFSFGGLSGADSTNAVNLTLTSGAFAANIVPGSWFNTFDTSASTGIINGIFATVARDTALNLNSVITSSRGISGILTMKGTGNVNYIASSLYGMTIDHTTPGITTLLAPLTISSGTAIGTLLLLSGNINLNGQDLACRNFNSTGTGTRAIAFGSNSITINGSGGSIIAYLNVPSATNFTVSGTGGFTTTMAVVREFNFGATAGGTSNNAPNLSLTSGAAIPTFTTGSWFNKLDFTGTTCVPVGSLSTVTSLNLNSLTLASGGTYTKVAATMSGTGIITGSSKAIEALTINHTGTTTFASALSCTTYTQTAGDVNFATFNLTASGAAAYTAGTLSNIGTIACTTWTIGTGSTFTISSGTISASTSFTLTSGAFNYNSSNGVITTPSFVHTAGTVTLGATLAFSATCTYTFTAGTLALAGFTLTTGTFASTNANTRSITFGAGNIVLAHTSIAQTVLSMAIATGFSYTGTGGFTSAMSVTRTFVFGTTGGSSTNAPNLSLTSGAATTSFTASSWFNLLNFTGHTGTIPGTRINVNSLILGSGQYGALDVVMAGTGNITSVSKSLANITISHTGVTTLLDAFTQGVDQTPLYMQTGTLNLGGFTCTISVFNNFGTGTRAIAFGSTNIVLAKSTSGVVINSSVVTNFSCTGTGGFTTAMSVDRSFSFNNSSYVVVDNAPNLSLTSGAGIPSFHNTSRGSWFKNLNFTGSTSTVSGDINNNRLTLYVQGLTLASGGNYDKLIASMYSTGNVDTAGNSTLGGLIINHSSGSEGNTTLAANLTLATNATTTLQSGNLVLAGFTLNNGIFNASGSTSRAIHFGAGSIALTHTTSSTTVLDIADATNFTTTGTGGFTSAMSVARTFVFGTTGGTSTNAPNLALTSGASIPTITTGSWFNSLNFTGTTSTPATTIVNVGALTLATGGTYTSLTPAFTATQTWTPQFSKQLGGFGVNGSGITVTQGGVQSIIATGITTLTAGILALGGYDLTTGTFSSTNINTRAIAFGTNNIVLATTTAAATVLDIADATNFTTTGAGGFTSAMSVAIGPRTFVFGTTGGTSTNAPNLALTSGASIPTITTDSWFNKLDFTGSTCTPAATSLNLNSLTLASGGTYTSLSPSMRGTGTIISNGKSIKALSFNSGVGTTTLSGNASIITDGTNLVAGVLALAGYTLNTNIFSSASSNIRTITGGGGIINVTDYWQVSNSTNWASSNYTINMNSASAKSFDGAGGAYGILNQGGAGALTISGSNYFEAMTATTTPSSVIFTAGTTQYISSTTFFSGSPGALVTLTSTTPTSAYNVSKSSGTINSDYLNITDSNATGGATWNAGSHSVNTARNTGWSFTGGAPVYAVGGQFLAFFA